MDVYSKPQSIASEEKILKGKKKRKEKRGKKEREKKHRRLGTRKKAVKSVEQQKPREQS